MLIVITLLLITHYFSSFHLVEWLLFVCIYRIKSLVFTFLPPQRWSAVTFPHLGYFFSFNSGLLIECWVQIRDICMSLSLSSEYLPSYLESSRQFLRQNTLQHLKTSSCPVLEPRAK